ncbi:hypothetical protein EV567_1573 [Streptomyces sp. BK239]|nr:hypothetical protein EV567_1573 [Streptomyces sp. BK239]
MCRISCTPRIPPQSTHPVSGTPPKVAGGRPTHPPTREVSTVIRLSPPDPRPLARAVGPEDADDALLPNL